MSNESTANAQTAAPLAPSALVNEALRLANMGYRVFPCLPGEKKPATRHGCLDATTDEDQIAAWWDENPAYNIGLSTDGLLVVDVDPLPGGKANDFANDTDRLSDLLVSAGAKTPRGGQHFFFRQTDGMDLHNTTGRIAPGVDTRANGGYVLVYPSKTEHGQYEWLPGYSLDVPAAKLPPPPLWLMDMLAEQPPQLVDRNAPESAAIIPDGQRNSTLTSLGGYLRRAGMLETEIKAALRAANVQRCQPPLEDAEIDRIAWSVARYEPDQTTQALAEGWALQDEQAAAPELQRDDKIPDPGPLPRELLQPGGFLQDVMDWNLSTAYKPQPELALAAALALLSVSTGRKIADQTGMRTNLYILGVGESGCGKDHARTCNKNLLHAAGMEKVIGPEEIKSDTGLQNAVRDNPALLFQLDEFGKYMGSISDAKSQPHLKQIVPALMRLYSSSHTLYVGGAVADTRNIVRIDQPHAVVYGTTVPESFFRSIPKESLSDGFLGRLVVFSASIDDPDEQEIEGASIPVELIEQARWWAGYEPGGNLNREHPAPRVVRYSDSAKAEYKSLEITAKAEAKSGRETAKIWTRVVEKARKLALLHQVSLDREAEQISEASARWGCQLASYLARYMEYVCGDWVAENQQESHHKRMLRLIKSYGAVGITSTVVQRKAQWTTKQQRIEILQTLESSGQIVASKMPSTGGRCPTRYVAV